jgi:ABC-type transport system involved in multi-copper enzyme maturation permease subunit
MIRLVRGEFLKIRTTNAWWLFALGSLGLLAVAFLYNAIGAYSMNEGAPSAKMSHEAAANFEVQSSGVYQAANLFTSGQFFGLLFVMLLGIVLVTNEFHHQTATTTFLTTPRRTLVVLAKLITAAMCGAGLWLVTTAINISATTMIFLDTGQLSTYLGEWPIVRAILLNLLAYTVWGILGVGFGVLIRSQIGATVTAVVLYLIGTTVAGIIFTVLSGTLDQDWIAKLQVIVPSIASRLMISGIPLPGNPPQWLGAAVLIGYAVVTGAIGTMIIRDRDIS